MDVPVVCTHKRTRMNANYAKNCSCFAAANFFCCHHRATAAAAALLFVSLLRTQYPEFAYLWPRVGIFKFQPKFSPPPSE